MEKKLITQLDNIEENFKSGEKLISRLKKNFENLIKNCKYLGQILSQDASCIDKTFFIKPLQFINKNPEILNKFKYIPKLFKFTKWKFIVDQKILKNCLQIHASMFYYQAFNQDNVKMWVEWQNIKAKLPPYPTSFTATKLNFAIKQLNTVWHKLDIYERDTAFCIIIGFREHFESCKTSQIEKTKRNCNSFIKEEIKAGRLFQIDEPFEVYANFIAEKYFSILEVKTQRIIFPNECEREIKYKKYRYVANNTTVNELLVEPAENLKYSFYTTLQVFNNDWLYKKLNEAYLLSVVDKSNFYRTFKLLPNPYFLILSNSGKFYQDIGGRMGNRFSPVHAQRCANLTDKAYNVRQNHTHIISLQDDSLCFHMTKHEKFLAEFQKLNEDFGFVLNSKKLQIQS